MKYNVCENCPCLNVDYESGADCKLGYDSKFEWFDKKTMKKVNDTPEMRSHQSDFELLTVSTNCGLMEIKTKDKVTIPKIIEG